MHSLAEGRPKVQLIFTTCFWLLFPHLKIQKAYDVEKTYTFKGECLVYLQFIQRKSVILFISSKMLFKECDRS